jgi:hypothetical protein
MLTAVSVGTGVVLVGGHDDGSAHGPATPPPDDEPDQPTDHEGWPAAIWPYASFVEQERGLDFKHPVPVRFLSDEDFRQKVTSDETKLTDRERRQIQQTEGLFRALGLLDGHTDLFEASNDLSGAGVIGYYSDKDKVVRVRGDRLTPATKVTLVHELTHALQDQHFDLLARDKEFEKDDDSSAASAFQALVEGDASRIERAYRDSLSDDERAAVEAEESKTSSRYENDVADVPRVLQTLMGAPYAFGEAMLAVATTVDGDDEVDALFRTPPTTDEQLIDPWTLVGDRDEPLKVGAVHLSRGEHQFDSGTFGELSWYLVLAERIPLIEALDASDGWGGDSYAGFRRNGSTCVRVRYRADTPNDLAEMESALDDWVAGDPSAASAERLGTELLFESCDRGSTADTDSDASDRAVGLALTRTYLSIAAFGGLGDGDEDVAQCVADGLVHHFSVSKLTNPDPSDDDVIAMQTSAHALYGQCSDSG